MLIQPSAPTQPKYVAREIVEMPRTAADVVIVFTPSQVLEAAGKAARENKQSDFRPTVDKPA